MEYEIDSSPFGFFFLSNRRVASSSFLTNQPHGGALAAGASLEMKMLKRDENFQCAALVQEKTNDSLLPFFPFIHFSSRHREEEEENLFSLIPCCPAERRRRRPF